MNRSHALPATNWPALTEQVVALVSDEQFAQAGVWRMRHVRVEICRLRWRRRLSLPISNT